MSSERIESGDIDPKITADTALRSPTEPESVGPQKVHSSKEKRELPERSVLRLELAGVIVAAVFGLAGAVLGALGFTASERNQRLIANQYLAQAWELMGGEPFALTIYHYEEIPSKLEQARWLIEDQALVIDSSNPRAWRYKGVYYDAIGRPVDAERAFRKAIAIEPRNSNIYSNLGVVLRKQGRLADAEYAHRQAILLAPADQDQAYYHSNLGIVLAMRSKLIDAVKEFNRAIDLNPRNSSFHCNLGFAELLLGNFADAAAAEQQAIRLDPKLTSAYYYLGCTLAAQGLVDQSAEAFRHVALLNPRWDLIKEARQDLKDKQSLANAERALSIAKQVTEALPGSTPNPIGRADD
jgi:Flp pilus assembly protein TadD